MVVLGVLIAERGSDQWYYGFLGRACVGSKLVYIIVVADIFEFILSLILLYQLSRMIMKY